MTSNKWTNNEIFEIIDGRLNFYSGGITYKENMDLDITKDGAMEITTGFLYTGGVGVAFLVHDSSNYLSFEIYENSAVIARTYKGKKSILNTKQLPDNIALTMNAPYTMKLVLDKYNIKSYIKNPIGEDLILLNDTDQTSFQNGSVGLLGIETEFEHSEEQSSIFSIYENISVSKSKKDNWTKSIVTDGTMLDYNTNEKHGKFMFNLLSDNSEYDLLVTKDYTKLDNFKQTVTNLQPGTYTLSAEYIGEVILAVYGTNINTSIELDYSEVNKRGNLVFTVLSTSNVDIIIGSSKEGYSECKKPQLELGYETLYTDGARAASTLTLPCSKINNNNKLTEKGSFSMLVTPINNNFTNDYIFYYSDLFNLKVNGSSIVLKYGSLTNTISKSLLKNRPYLFTVIWSDSNLILDMYDYSKNTYTYNIIKNTQGQVDKSDVIYVGCNQSSQSNMIVDNIKSFIGSVNAYKLRAQLIHGDKSYDNYAIKSEFNSNTFLYNSNKINIPYFDMNSPVVVQDVTNDIIYSRVSFFNEDMNYTLYNTERVQFTSRNKFIIGFDNVIKAWVEDDSGEEYHNIKIEKEMKDGSYTYNSIITVEDLDQSDVGKYLTIKYILKDSYCITESTQSENYLIEFSNVYGGDITVTIEEETEEDKVQLKSVELNPFRSSNNTGFVFLEEKERPVRFLYGNASPDSIIADGYDYSTITIDCLDKDGVPTNNVFLYDSEDPSRLTVYSKRGLGRVSLYMTDEERQWWAYLKENGREATERDLGQLINDENRAGRYVFTYKPSKFLNEDTVEKEDFIVVVDGKTKMSTEIPIRITGGW